jgi:3-methyladenine DNA glycosylase Tag
MIEIDEVLFRWQQRHTQAEISRSLGQSRQTVRKYLRLAQAGLSWLTILKKRQNYRKAFHGFDVGRVAGYGEKDVARLLGDPGIVRNRLKIDSAIRNASSVVSSTSWLVSQ